MGDFLQTYSFLHILLFMGHKMRTVPSVVLHFVGFYFLLLRVENFSLLFAVCCADRPDYSAYSVYSAYPVYRAVYCIVCGCIYVSRII